MTLSILQVCTFQLHFHMIDFEAISETLESILCLLNEPSQLAFTCSKLTIETLEQGVKYVQN